MSGTATMAADAATTTSSSSDNDDNTPENCMWPNALQVCVKCFTQFDRWTDFTHTHKRIHISTLTYVLYGLIHTNIYIFDMTLPAIQ